MWVYRIERAHRVSPDDPVGSHSEGSLQPDRRSPGSVEDAAIDHDHPQVWVRDRVESGIDDVLLAIDRPRFGSRHREYLGSGRRASEVAPDAERPGGDAEVGGTAAVVRIVHEAALVVEHVFDDVVVVHIDLRDWV